MAICANQPLKSRKPAGSMTLGCPTDRAKRATAALTSSESRDGRGCLPLRLFTGGVGSLVGDGALDIRDATYGDGERILGMMTKQQLTRRSFCKA